MPVLPDPVQLHSRNKGEVITARGPPSGRQPYIEAVGGNCTVLGMPSLSRRNNLWELG